VLIGDVVPRPLRPAEPTCAEPPAQVPTNEVPDLRGVNVRAHLRRLLVGESRSFREWLTETCWLAQQRGYCFARQARLGRQVELSVRTVRTYQQHAVELGLLRVVRTGRANELWPDWEALQLLTPEVADQSGSSCRSLLRASSPSPSEAASTRPAVHKDQEALRELRRRLESAAAPKQVEQSPKESPEGREGGLDAPTPRFAPPERSASSTGPRKVQPREPIHASDHERREVARLPQGLSALKWLEQQARTPRDAEIARRALRLLLAKPASYVRNARGLVQSQLWAEAAETMPANHVCRPPDTPRPDADEIEQLRRLLDAARRAGKGAQAA
jgi:hypothetical protein